MLRFERGDRGRRGRRRRTKNLLQDPLTTFDRRGAIRVRSRRQDARLRQDAAAFAYWKLNAQEFSLIATATERGIFDLIQSREGAINVSEISIDDI